MSGNDDEAVAWQVVADVMGKGRGLAIVDGRHIDAATKKLVDEGTVVIGTHGVTMEDVVPLPLQTS